MPAWMKNRYVLTVLIFLVWIILLDPNNLIHRGCVRYGTRNRLEQGEGVLHGAHRGGPQEAE
ncbi:MAG: hypothetical protein MZV63_54985 [Marinilabiliales bacterium]|nr:hypothetical protein [Marinilabiliales bacterium]